MRGEWGGEEEPPLEELERLWAREAASAGGPEHTDPTETWPGPAPMEGDRAPSLVRETEPCGPLRIARSMRRVLRSSTSIVDSRARRAADFAEMADAADEDSWEQAPAARMTSATDAIAALAHASTTQRAACVTCSSAPAVVGWSTGPGSPSPTRSQARCSPSRTHESCASAAPAPGRLPAAALRSARTT